MPYPVLNQISVRFAFLATVTMDRFRAGRLTCTWGGMARCTLASRQPCSVSAIGNPSAFPFTKTSQEVPFRYDIQSK
jgi:hypothetical protein